MIRRTFALSLGVVALAACGGTVVVGSGGAGTTGATGAGATTSTTGTTGTTGTMGSGGSGGGCPSAVPAQGAPCSDPTLTCSYGTCCAATATCDGSTWSVAQPDCPALQCPQTVPDPGAACDLCTDAPMCSVPCPGSSAKVDITCVGTWLVSTACPGPPPVACGSTTCTGGEICLVKSGGAVTPPTCIANPCGTAALGCSCAESVCSGSVFQCSVTGQTLDCTCPNCP